MTYRRAIVHQDEPKRRLQNFLNPLLEGGAVRDALDVGCGHALPIDFPLHVHLAGLDTSAEALASNENVDERLLGDIETYPLPPSSFDAILCWTVLEHVERPALAVRKMIESLRPDGLLIIGVPDPWSLKGLVTKLTPHRFHIWVYRHLLNSRDAGKPGHAPFRTVLHRDMAPKRLEELVRSEGMDRIYTDRYEHDLGLPLLVSFPWRLVNYFLHVVTIGRWRPHLSEYIGVFRNPGAG